MIASPAQTFTNLVNFNGTNGSFPGYMSLAQGRDGNLYGTTESGGPNGYGTIFRMTPSGKLTTLYSFSYQGGTYPNGAFPYAGLLLGTDGVFYGTTFEGGPSSSLCVAGCGSVFKITRNGVLTTIHTFSLTDGANPVGALIQGTDGNLYGTTEFGGGGNCANLYNPGCGTVFKINSKLGFSTLHSFAGADGWNVHGGLVQGTDGDFYGTTAQGGSYSGGTVFRITPGGALTTLYNFCAQTNCADGETPYAPLIQAADGDFYGTAVAGGGICGFFSSGTIFKITPDGTLTTLESSCEPEAPLIQGSDGNLYGTTFTGGNSNTSACYAVFSAGCGTVFEISTGNLLTILHSFDLTDGDLPTGGVLQATSGTFYGTTSVGGANSEGTVFRLTGQLGPFISFVLPVGKVGKTAEILGQGFTGTTSVAFNGVAATSFSVVSDTYMTAIVPSGATTGPVVVTTPSGKLTSNKNFQIVQ